MIPQTTPKHYFRAVFNTDIFLQDGFLPLQEGGGGGSGEDIT